MPQIATTLEEVQMLVVGGRFAVKVLAFLLNVCTMYVIRMQRSTEEESCANWMWSIEDALLHFLFWTCLLIAVILVVHLVQDVFHISNSSRVVAIMLVPYALLVLAGNSHIIKEILLLLMYLSTYVLCFCFFCVSVCFVIFCACGKSRK